MKNFFVLLLIFLAFLSIDHELVSKPRAKLFGFFESQFDSFATEKKNKVAQKTQRLIKDKLTLTSKQSSYVAKTFDTDTNLNKFNQNFCVKKSLSIYFQGDQLRQVCLITKAQTAQLNQY